MEISAAQVKELRQATGVGMMECKKALQENQGNFDKAIVWLRERGMSRAAAKADRAAAEGIVAIEISNDHTQGVLVELNCETDFAGKNTDFQEFAKKTAEIALALKSNDIEKLKSAKYGNQTVSEALAALIAKVGENMKIRRLAYVEQKDGLVISYSHMGGRIGVLVALQGGTNKDKIAELGKDVAMHVAASSPKYLDRTQVPNDELEQEKSIGRKRLIEQGKAGDILEKALIGQVNRYYQDVCLVDQPFVKENKLTVAKVVKDEGCGATLAAFVRFQLGDGVEVKTGNFAEEVAEQLRK